MECDASARRGKAVKIFLRRFFRRSSNLVKNKKRTPLGALILLTQFVRTRAEELFQD
jgi:hypothetical protein